MITKVDLALEQAIRKCGFCGNESLVDLKKLRLGGPGGNPDFIPLPACKCGAGESIRRTFSEHFKVASPSPSHLTVNVIADHLRKNGRIWEEFKLQVASEGERAYGAVELEKVTRFTPESLHEAFIAVQT